MEIRKLCQTFSLTLGKLTIPTYYVNDDDDIRFIKHQNKVISPSCDPFTHAGRT